MCAAWPTLLAGPLGKNLEKMRQQRQNELMLDSSLLSSLSQCKETLLCEARQPRAPFPPCQGRIKGIPLHAHRTLDSRDTVLGSLKPSGEGERQ